MIARRLWVSDAFVRLALGVQSMTDLATENLMPFQDMSLRLCPRPSGRRIPPSTVYRWIQRGVRRVRLEVIRIRSSTYTSLEVLQRFADRQGTPASQVLDR